MASAESIALSGDIPLPEAPSPELEEAVRLHARLVYRVAYAVARNHPDAEDIVQETFLRLLRYGRLEEIRNLRAWLARVAWRAALDRLRKRRRSAELPLEEVAGPVRQLHARGANAEKLAASNEMIALLERLIATLPPKLRTTFQLSTEKELSGAEIARVLEIPEASVRTRLFRARQLLQQKLSAVLESKERR